MHIRREHYGVCTSAKGFIKGKDESGTQFNKKADYLLRPCGGMRNTNLFFNKVRVGNGCGSYTYGNCNAAFFLFSNV